MKASFPCLVVPGPVGPCEVLRHGPIPTLFAFQANSGWLSMAGDTEGLRRLARLLDWLQRDDERNVAIQLYDPARTAS